MKAVILKERGPLGVFWEDVPEPEAPAGWAKVKMVAATVNRVDLYMRDSGAGIRHEMPLIMGVDGVGRVVEAPEGSGFNSGDPVILYPYEFCGHCRHCLVGNQPLCVTARILGEHRHGTFAEYVVVPARSLVKLRHGVNMEQAACLGVAYLTAWRMVFGKTEVTPGMVVAVQGAGGGVGYAAMQLARMAGARVIVTTSGEEKLEHFRSLGVDAIDYRVEDVPHRLGELTDQEGADIVIDNVGERTWPLSLRMLARGGHLITCGATTGAHPSADIQRLFVRQLSVHGSTMGSLEEFRRLVRAWEAGEFTPLIDRAYSFAEVPQAFQHLEDPVRMGKLVIRIS